MDQFRSRLVHPKRVWRVTASAPQGEYVDVDVPSSHVPPPSDLHEAAQWAASSFDLASGLEVVESDDPALADFIGELLKSPAA